jgi:hypothetical protein
MPEKDKQAIDYQVYGPITHARCPRCERVHKLRLMWSGHGVPRIFCARCRSTIDRNQALSNDDITHQVGIAARWSRVPMASFETKQPISEMELIPHYR